jgi:NADPH:quinone reductase-like Zn-dependent oxidoreductase
MFLSMNQHIESTQIRPVIDRVFPFEDSLEAFRHLESARHFGKVVIRLPN